MFKYTTYTLKKIESLFESIGYSIRYEKGNFQSGYCIVENKQIAVINKFFETEARINSLMDILSTITVDETLLDQKQLEVFKKLMKWNLNEEEVVTDALEEGPSEEVPE